MANKLPQKKCYRVDDVSVMACGTERSERDLVKRLDALDIDWTMPEKQPPTSRFGAISSALEESSGSTKCLIT